MATMHREDELDTRVAAAIGGDSGARSALWRDHRRWLAAILLSYKPREVDLEDLMQDVAIKYVSKLDTLRDVGAFKPWLRRIAINTARESARSIRGTRGQRTIDERGSHEAASDGESVLPERDEARALLAHALTLPPEFREPLVLRCVKGMGCRQIAELLDLPVTTIETRLSRGRRMLREEWRSRRTADPDPSPDPSPDPTPGPGPGPETSRANERTEENAPGARPGIGDWPNGDHGNVPHART